MTGVFATEALVAQGVDRDTLSLAIIDLMDRMETNVGRLYEDDPDTTTTSHIDARSFFAGLALQYLACPSLSYVLSSTQQPM